MTENCGRIVLFFCSKATAVITLKSFNEVNKWLQIIG